MPLQFPNLDDRTYDDLVQEALSLIPTYAPEWTNYNPSDPGITLIELFAYLTEMLNYRLNRVTNANKQTFLNLISENKYPLINEKGEPQPLDEKRLNEEIRTAVVNLRKANRAVTCKDFENLALEANQTGALKNSQQKVARAHCVLHRHLESENSRVLESERPGHVSVVIVPDKPPQTNAELQPNPELLDAVSAYLEPKRLLTTRLHVVKPRYLTIRVQITLVLKPGAKEDGKNGVRLQIVKVLQDFFHPLIGGAEGKGWAFGRNIYISEIYELLDRQPGVDYVIPTKPQQSDKPLEEVLVLSSDAEQRKVKVNVDKQLQLSAVKVKAYELVNLQINDGDITIIPAYTSATGG